jgi:hypothetical protein
VANTTSVTRPPCEAASGDPHRRQKCRCFPGDDSYPATDSAPDVQRDRSGSMIPQVANAAPWAFLHIEQWQ